jgi:hypothetical protein
MITSTKGREQNMKNSIANILNTNNRPTATSPQGLHVMKLSGIATTSQTSSTCTYPALYQSELSGDIYLMDSFSTGIRVTSPNGAKLGMRVSSFNTKLVPYYGTVSITSERG